MGILFRALLLVALAVPALSVAGEAPPRTALVVPGLDARTEIRIDRWGVPHIYATTRHDAFFVQGWNAGRDRLWQIDLWRRSGLGELSAVLGSAYAEQDRAIRLFVYRGDMDAEWAAYGAAAKPSAAAFVAGINAYVTAILRDPALMPAEFRLAGYSPALWKVDDIVRIRNHGLVVGVGLQLTRAQVACKVGLEAADVLLPVSPPWTPVVPDGLDLCSIPGNVLEQYHLAQKAVGFSAATRQAANPAPAAAMPVDDAAREAVQGSNNWVVAPAKSATGRPILANDPHRNEEVPSLRYLVHLNAPGLDVIGAGEPSLPGISIGHNAQIAFGLTVFPIAQEDLYVYETNPANPVEYRYRDGWEAMHVVHESVAVRGGTSVDVELRFTRHGPVVMEDVAHHRAYAVRATWLATGGAPYFASMRYLRARNIEDFRAALKYWGEPGENQIFADTTGKIGWFPAGFTPIRHNSDGLLPLPGDGRYEWDGMLDRDLLPSAVDPARHYIATANQLNLPADFPYAERRVGFVWYDDDRFSRISEVLDGRSKVSLRDSEALQNDYVSVPARRLIRLLGAIPTDNVPLKETIRWLEAWNGQVTAASPEAALFEVWVSHHLGAAVLSVAVPSAPDSMRTLVSGTGMATLDLLEHPEPRLGVNAAKSRDDILLRTLAAALEETKQRLGPDRATWQWGKLSSTLFQHPLSPLADASQRALMNVGPAPKAGDGSTVGAAYYRQADFRLTSGASFRMVLDVGHWDDSVAVNTPGESGDWTSAHYRDLFPLWLGGEYFPLAYSRAAVEQATERVIVLAPR